MNSFTGNKVVYDALGETVMNHYARAAQAELHWHRRQVTQRR